MTELTKEAVTAIADLARLASEAGPHPAGGLYVKRPDGSVVHLQPQYPPLYHIDQAVNVMKADSFSAYVNRFKGEATTIFAKADAPLLMAIIDYHSTDAARCDHRVSFVPPWSEEWARWRALDGKSLTQMEFAEFIEENMVDVVEPDGAALLDVVTGLQAHRKVTFESGVRLHDGSNQLVYHEDIEAKGRGTLTVPSEFALGVPVFFGGEAFRVRCMLRYRITEGKLVFAVRVIRRRFIEQSAFDDIVKAVATATGIQVLHGWV